MAEVAELLTFLATYLAHFLDDGSFRIVDSEARPHHCSIRVESASTVLSFVAEHEERSVRVAPVRQRDEWFWIGVYRRALSTQPVYTDELDPEAGRFMAEHLDAIDRAFADDEAAVALTALLRAERERRATEMFGGPRSDMT